MLVQLKEKIAELGSDGLCIAFSGGVDSALILKIAGDLKLRVCAVTFHTMLHPIAELAEAKEMAGAFGVEHEVILLDEYQDEAVMKNTPERCYHCKRLLFATLCRFAQERGLGCVMDGTNADDLTEYRPGVRALGELGIKSPLASLGITKEQVRAMALELGLRVAKKPSSPCLATRLPYHTPITREAIAMIERGEELLRQTGFPVNRVRKHGGIARIEIPPENFGHFLECRGELVPLLLEFGFDYVTLDMEGFRSGSMDLEKVIHPQKDADT